MQAGVYDVWTLVWQDLPDASDLPEARLKPWFDKPLSGIGVHDKVAAVLGAPSYSSSSTLNSVHTLELFLRLLEAPVTAARDYQDWAVSRAFGTLEKSTMIDNSELLQQVGSWLPAPWQDRHLNDQPLLLGRKQVADVPTVSVVAAIPRSGLQRWTDAMTIQMSDARQVADLRADGGALVATNRSGENAAAAAVNPETGTSLPLIPVAVCLHIDDSDTSSPEYKQAWQRFWAAANLLQYLPEFMPTSRSGIEALRYAPIIEAAADLSTNTAKNWVQSETDSPQDDLPERTDQDAEFVDELVQFTDWPTELKALIESGVAVPDEVGLDITLEDSVDANLEWVWNTAKVGFLASDNAQLKTRFTEAGWRIVTSVDADGCQQLKQWLQ
jgi:hypothetical protein